MKIAHISDLHFGAHDPKVRDALLAHLIEAKPHLVIASGDITQSATDAEFAAARVFFDKLPMEVFVIPGNHDLPGMDLTRFINPFGRYRRHLIDELDPELAAGPVHIKGINTARRILPHWNWANGAVSAKQRREIAQTFTAATAPWRILVLHHGAAIADHAGTAAGCHRDAVAARGHGRAGRGRCRMTALIEARGLTRR